MESPALTLLNDIGKSHERMVRLAGQSDWDGVSGEWNVALRMLLELRQFSPDQLSGHERAEAAQQIEKLLELEAQLSGQISPWLEQVRPLLESLDKYPLGLDRTASK
jgi:Flagellar protein FliT.